MGFEKDTKKNKYGKPVKVIKAGMDDLRNIKKIAKKEEVKIQCKCQHVDEYGKSALFRSKKKSDTTGNTLFCCHICQDYIDIAPISSSEMDDAVDKVITGINMIKFRLQPQQSESDRKLFKSFAKMEYILKSGKYKELFDKASQPGNKRKSNSMGNFVTGAPVSTRR